MAYRKCPSCGSGYNGKRCGNCFYEPFGEVKTSFDLHREEGIPKREVPQPRPGDPSRTREQSRQNPMGKTILKRLGTIWAVILLLTSVLPVIFEAVLDVGASFVEATPEPLLPEGMLLYEDADILVLADWDGISPITEDIPIYVQNFTGKDLTVCTNGVAVNGCMTNDVFFYCDAAAETVSKTPLWVDMEVLEETGIKEVQNIRMVIDVMDGETYDYLTEGVMAELGEAYFQGVDVSGTVIYEKDGFTLIYQGMDTDQFGDLRLCFYGENYTDSYLELTSDGLLIDGEETGCYPWQNFLPGTKAVFYGRIHDFAVPGENASAEMTLYMTRDGDWSRAEELGTVNFRLN